VSTDSPRAFYDALASQYDLVYDDWPAAIARQAKALDALICELTGAGSRTVLDVACGIGTQCLGLAALGHAVTASDLSAAAVERATREAAARGLPIEFSVCDMRDVPAHHASTFDVVLCADNSLPHLACDDDILRALRGFRERTADGGVCIVSMRDYAAIARGGVQIHPHGVRERDGTRYVVFQVWTWHGEHYDVDLYIVCDAGEASCATDVVRATYYAIPIERVLELMREAGFVGVERRDGAFFQPLVIGRRSGSA
jgi:SAM-dependent methyltransferase